jgi:glycogen operon protein
MIETGRPDPLGATFDGDGVNFALFTERAESVVLCLFASEREVQQIELPGQSNGVWHGYLPGCRPGQRYAYRVHGPWSLRDGLRFNAAKLLLDPWARDLAGEFVWSSAVFDYTKDGADFRINPIDSAPYLPKCIVTGASAFATSNKPRKPWSETVIYEANVRGYTMRHPGVPDADKGTYRGMCNGAILSHLKSLGITSVELMPVQEFIDEEFLAGRGLRNYWGYNTIQFFTPAGRYSRGNRCEEFRDMVNAIHDAGLEVFLDVAYNHTGEGDTQGPTIAFRGIDNLSYYRTIPGQPADYINDTGCGNTVNVDHPRVREFIVQSLRFWAADMGVDGFRFDLATVLGRHADGFTKAHPLLQAIEQDRVLREVKLIAEPWDVGPGGYRLGGFGSRWHEWNDRFRDSARRFWRGDHGEAAEFARRLHGSSDLFEASGRGPPSSINLVTAHDGFTLADVVSYEQRHNEANGEFNRDGHAHNFSRNYGVEGETDDETIREFRRRQRLNMLATLLFSQGTPMLLGGDEFGNSQRGNNNAYAQDNDTGWIDWSGLAADPAFFEQVRTFVELRRSTPLLRQDRYAHGVTQNGSGWPDIEWLRPDGERMQDRDWSAAAAMTLLQASTSDAKATDAVALLVNASSESVKFRLPDAGESFAWRVAVSSSDALPQSQDTLQHEIPPQTLACLILQQRFR